MLDSGKCTANDTLNQTHSGKVSLVQKSPEHARKGQRLGSERDMAEAGRYRFAEGRHIYQRFGRKEVRDDLEVGDGLVTK